MDESLRRRLVGAAVLLAGAWLLAALLPSRTPDPERSSGHVVTYDLRTGRPMDLPPIARSVPHPATAPPEPVQPEPSEPAAAIATTPAVTAPPATPEHEAPPPEPATAKAAAPEPAAAPQAAPVPKAPAQATLAHPVLKVDEHFGEKAPANAWYVQIGSFASEGNARGVMTKLYGAKLPALIQTVPQGQKLWYRVRVGPYKAESTAQTALLTIKQKGFNTAKLVKPETSPAPARN